MYDYKCSRQEKTPLFEIVMLMLCSE